MVIIEIISIVIIIIINQLSKWLKRRKRNKKLILKNNIKRLLLRIEFEIIYIWICILLNIYNYIIRVYK